MVLPDVPEVRRLLDDLRHGRPAGALRPVATAALARLERADLLAPPPADDAAEPTVATASLRGPRRLVEVASTHLRAAGLTLRPDGDVRLLLAHGALRREATDQLVRDGVAHLVSVVTPWGWDVGPLVVPGQTACLRCVDAALSDHDPRHGVVLGQLARSSPPVTSSPALLSIALGWIARDLLAYARGARPSTWSTTVRLTETPDDGRGEEPVRARRWLRHPHCGCAWDALTG